MSVVTGSFSSLTRNPRAISSEVFRLLKIIFGRRYGDLVKVHGLNLLTLKGRKILVASVLVNSTLEISQFIIQNQ